MVLQDKFYSSWEEFYSSLEEGVRDVVYKLRNAGINTIASCHHEGSITAEFYNFEEDLEKIDNVMFEMGITCYRVMVCLQHNRNSYKKWIEIFSPCFIKD